MGLRYLFGTVTGAAPAILQADRPAGRCLVFGDGPGVDVVIPAGATWPTIEDRLPAGWRPDFLLLDLSVAPIPTWSWTAPVPVVGLAPIGDAASGPARRLWRRCDRILAGPAVDRARLSDSPADWDALIAALDREWPEIALRAAGRRAGGDAGRRSPRSSGPWTTTPSTSMRPAPFTRPWVPAARSGAVAGSPMTAGCSPTPPRSWCRGNHGSPRLRHSATSAPRS